MQLAINLAMVLTILLQIKLIDKLIESKLILELYSFAAKNGKILIVAEILALAANFFIDSN